MLCFTLSYSQLHLQLTFLIYFRLVILAGIVCMHVHACVCVCVYLTNNDQQYSYEGQKGDVERAAQSHTGDDEGDNEDEEADDHQRSHCLGPSWGPTQTYKLVRLVKKTPEKS